MTDVANADGPRPKVGILPNMRTYVAALAIGAVVVVAGYGALLFSLDRLDRLPPPQLSNDLCIDEKLKFLREHPPGDADLLIIGSSVAWRHFDSAAAAARSLKPYNAGLCGLKVSQNAAVTSWLLERVPTVKTLILIASPLDYEACLSAPASPFDIADADSYSFGGGNAWGYYFHYFDPLVLARNAASLATQRADITARNTMVMTQYGDGPSDPPDNGLSYGAGLPLDASCFAGLKALATEVQASGRALIVVDSPIHPDWKAQFDPDGAKATDRRARIDLALSGTGAVHWNGDAAFNPGAAGFFDAIHLRWPAVQEFTQVLLDAVALTSPGSQPAPIG